MRPTIEHLRTAWPLIFRMLDDLDREIQAAEDEAHYCVKALMMTGESAATQTFSIRKRHDRLAEDAANKRRLRLDILTKLKSVAEANPPKVDA